MSMTSRQIMRRLGTDFSATELGFIDGVTAGTAAANKAVVLNGSLGITTITSATITTLTSTTANVPTVNATNVDAGASGTAGTVDIFPTTASKGKIALTATANTNNDTTTITNAAQGGAYTYTIPNLGASGNFVLASAFQSLVDGVSFNASKWVDVTVTAALLDAAGSVNVIAGVAGDQYKIRGIRLVGGGTNFGAGGDRLISLTDGTTVWTTIANADIESAPAATLHWGDTKVPYLTGTADTASASAAAIRFQYSGGASDHTTGSIKFSVLIEKVA